MHECKTIDTTKSASINAAPDNMFYIPVSIKVGFFQKILNNLLKKTIVAHSE